MLNNTPRGNAAAGLAEYGLLVALIAIVCLAGISAVGIKVNGTLLNVAGAI